MPEFHCLIPKLYKKDENLKGYQVDDITAEIIEEIAQYLNRDIIKPEN